MNLFSPFKVILIYLKLKKLFKINLKITKMFNFELLEKETFAFPVIDIIFTKHTLLINSEEKC